MMKRIVSLVLISLFLLTLAGCNSETSDPASPETSTNQTSGNESEEKGQSSSDSQADNQSNKGNSTNEGGYNTSSGTLATEKDENFIDFQKKTKPMTKKEAETYLSDQNADKSKPEYRQAVFTVNSSSAESVIHEAQETKTITPEVKQLFDKIHFRFIEGDSFASSTVKIALSKLGQCEKGEDGIYYFVFYDRTLAQATTNQEGDPHSLNAYTEVLNLLLNDPNVDVLIKN